LLKNYGFIGDFCVISHGIKVIHTPVDKPVDNPVDKMWITQKLSTPLGGPVDKMWITLAPPVDNFFHTGQGFFDLFSKLSTDFIHYNY
jgi:hypothetical protein